MCTATFFAIAIALLAGSLLLAPYVMRAWDAACGMVATLRALAPASAACVLPVDAPPNYMRAARMVATARRTVRRARRAVRPLLALGADVDASLTRAYFELGGTPYARC
jgi:hypothetical protein